MVERFVYTEDVGSSSLSSPTKFLPIYQISGALADLVRILRPLHTAAHNAVAYLSTYSSGLASLISPLIILPREAFTCLEPSPVFSQAIDPPIYHR